MRRVLLAKLTELIKRVQATDGDEAALKEVAEFCWNAEWPLHSSKVEWHWSVRSLIKILSREEYRNRISNVEKRDLLKVLVGASKGATTEGHDFLRSHLSDAERLIVCDPYLLKAPSGKDPLRYAEEFFGILPQTLKVLEVFVDRSSKKTSNEEVESEFRQISEQRGISFSVQDCKQVHDRVWIADDDRAYLVGASFNGLGKKYAFILDLPSNDRNDFLSQLERFRLGDGNS